MLALGAAGYGSERRRRGAWAPPEPSWLLSGMRAGPACLYLNLWNARRSRSGEAALEPQGVVHREALPVVVEVGEDLGVLAPGADPLAPLRLEALYALALTTGMRQGELLGLKSWDHPGPANALHGDGRRDQVRCPEDGQEPAQYHGPGAGPLLLAEAPQVTAEGEGEAH